MPFTFQVTRCPRCGLEFTVYISPRSETEVDLFWSCVDCEKADREAAKQPEASDQRGDQAMGGGGDEPIHLVSSQKSTTQHHVYELVDSRDNSVFYVGTTMNPSGREYEHRAPNSTSAALPRIQEIKAGGGHFFLRIVASFDDRLRAEAFEAILINQGKDLTNRRVPRMPMAV